MEEAFGYVLFGVVILAAVVAVFSLAGAGEAYRQIGRGGLSLNEDDDGRPRSSGGGGAPAPPAPSSAAETDAEIRQMIGARNARRARRGEAPLDVDEEVRKLAAPSADAGLRSEIRELVVARNGRRVRRGKEPLDVDAEVERQLRELT